MESIIRALVVYLFLFLVFRLSGKRTLSQATPFELVLLLIISETTQQAMVDGDHSVINCAILVLTLVVMDNNSGARESDVEPLITLLI